MRKIVDAEKLKPLLLYTENVYFLKDDEPYPYNESEVLETLCKRMNGTTPNAHNSLQRLSLNILFVIIMIGLPLWFAYDTATSSNPYTRGSSRTSLIVISLISVALFFLVLGAKEIFEIVIYSPKRLASTYERFKQEGTPVKGILVKNEQLGNDWAVNYLFTSPRSGRTIRKTYHSSGKVPHRNAPRSEVIVWYYSDNINALL